MPTAFFIATLSSDGKSITFKLIVANMENVTMAHIHIGDSATNGPVVVFLFHTETPVARQDGILSQGTFTASDFKGPLMGQAFSALIKRDHERRRLRQRPLNTASGRGDPRTNLHRWKDELISQGSQQSTSEKSSITSQPGPSGLEA